MSDNFPILIAEDDPVSRKLLEKVLIKADKYLYQAKREGRNRVMGGPLD